MGGDRVDFFVSHAGSDRAWAEWVAWQLTEAGYSVELDVWDWATGQNFVTAISDALDRCDRIVALFSAAYFDRSRYTTNEWASSLLHVPGADDDRLVPVRVEEVPATQMPAVLRPLLFRDLFGMDEEQARRALLAAVASPVRPDRQPGFPGHAAADDRGGHGESGPRLPGSPPRVWNVPARNPGFTGRDGLLVAVRERLLSGDRAVVQALHGMGGVGKTQLAAEYAHQFAGGYDVVWWVNAEHAGVIGEHFIDLAAELGCADRGALLGVVRRAVLADLRDRGRWLLIFDNAESPDEVVPWLPGGGGHVLITSRAQGWEEVAASVEVDVLARPESVAILCTRVPGLTEADANQLAEQLGDLPLAIAQAAGYLAETGMRASEYLALLGTRAAELFSRGRPQSYPLSLAGATQVAADQLGNHAPVAVELLGLCAYLAPEPIPYDLFTAAIGQLPSDLAAQVADPLAWRELLSVVGRSSLARIDQDGIQLHRLTQAILRDLLADEEATVTRARAEAILVANDPGDPEDPRTWQRWARLIPHLLIVGPAGTDNASLRDLTASAAWYLLKRGNADSSHDLAGHLHRIWRDEFGDDSVLTLKVATTLAQTLQVMGRYAEARDLDRETLERHRRVLGGDHPSTLVSANNLAVDLRALGEVQEARDLDRDTLERRRRVLGGDHPSTLVSASNLANDLRALDSVEAARNLDQDTLERRRRLLGADHPSTLNSISNLANDFRAMGEMDAARDLDQDALEGRRRVLGSDHPSALMSANNLGVDLRALGDTEAAHRLDQDTLQRRRRILGDDHPRTLSSASNLANDLRALGQTEAARILEEDTIQRSRRILGNKRLSTLANDLGVDLFELGEAQTIKPREAENQ
jgi:hypothetical protein